MILLSSRRAHVSVFAIGCDVHNGGWIRSGYVLYEAGLCLVQPRCVHAFLSTVSTSSSCIEEDSHIQTNKKNFLRTTHFPSAFTGRDNNMLGTF